MKFLLSSMYLMISLVGISQTISSDVLSPSGDWVKPNDKQKY